jgi:putative transposase
MANTRNSLAHTKWMCEYHIVFTPKYRWKIIYNQYRESIGGILRQLCGYKGVEIIEGHLMIEHVHMLVSIPSKISARAKRLERSDSQRLETLAGKRGL